MGLRRIVVCCVLFLGTTLMVEAGKKARDRARETSNTDVITTVGSIEFEYMVKYGWFPPNVQHDPESGKSALQSMQLFAGLEPTGVVNNATRELLLTPRCGNPDVFGANRLTVKRRKRYATSSYRWSRMELKYYFINYSLHLTRQETRSAITRAFDLWAEHSPISFQETSEENDADLVIAFYIGEHGDGFQNAFDGPRGTLAHAFFPEDGRAHFDDEEDFTVGVYDGINLFIVAAHEFGHALGLSHSDVQGSLMYPWYQGYVEDYQLPADDISGIQQMYGMPTVDEVPAGDGDMPDTAVGDNLPDTCTSSWDAVDRSFDGKVFAYKGKYIWRIRNTGGATSGFPKTIKSVYKKAPSNVDAVVTSQINQKTYFFKGKRYWRFTNYQLDRNFPKKIRPTGLPKSVAAAFVWGGNGKIHIFKGDYFYIFNEHTGKIKGSKRNVADKWRGIPTSITSAFQWKNGKTYFFKKDRYWRFDDDALEKEADYPKSKSLYWLGCGATSRDLGEPIKFLPDDPAVPEHDE